ncbi:MAG: response regulator transcription factor [Thermoanaerobaculaceae bacterium]|nr:response regulator transcription factor [Thermoanaerobaculaceae bacterium]MDI9622869.1 response regulator transcription factor [Acidobacteriota bacterium]HPW56763.1 response regulator transcription factor [Thermoanaerobaculaceae bacterium]
MIRVVIADDHTMFRAGLRALLAVEDDIEVVGEAANGAEAIARAKELTPDIVVMDILMPVMNGLEATRLIAADCPTVRVLVLSMYDDEEHVQQLLAAGAAGFVLKHATSDELVRAIHEVVAGGMPLSPSVAAKVVRDYARRVRGEQEGATSATLTGREREVLTLVAQGHTNQAIAELLGLSRKTVEVHRTHLMRKLDLHDVTEVVKYALRAGLITLDG